MVMTGEFRGMMTDGHKSLKHSRLFMWHFRNEETLNYFVVRRA